jgi:hypothetical protein
MPAIEICVTLQRLRRSLRRRSVSVDHEDEEFQHIYRLEDATLKSWSVQTSCG